jgi:hypothetical protein
VALSPADKQRRYRERQRVLAEQRAREALIGFAERPSYVEGSFGEYLAGKHLELEENLDALGIVIDGTSLDEEPQRFRSQVVREEPIDALQRASGLVDVFIDAAKELADKINAFKLQEIERAIEDAIADSAALPRGDVEALKTSFAEIERLKAIRTALRKPTRLTIAAIRADDE